MASDCPFRPHKSEATLEPAGPLPGDATPTWGSPSQLTDVIPLAESRASRPRVIDIYADGPCDAYVRWWGGKGKGGVCWFTLARAARISVDARTVQVKAWNRSVAENVVAASISDGRQDTKNTWSVEWYGGSPPSGGVVSVPPFARSVQWLSNVAVSPGELRLRNSFAAVVGTVSAGDKVDVGGAVDVILGGTGGTELASILFELGI